MQAVVADLNGNVIWYCSQSAIPPRPLPNGHFLFQESVLIEEVDLACNSIRSVSLDQVNQSLQTQGYTFGQISFFHHDAIALPNGHWIALGEITKNYTDMVGYPGTTAVVGDVLIDIDLNGNVAWAWSAFDYLDINRHLEGLPDWTHSNAIVYTEDGNLLLSMRHDSWSSRLTTRTGPGPEAFCGGLAKMGISTWPVAILPNGFTLSIIRTLSVQNQYKRHANDTSSL
jgi:arylsulfate sulfotransferase